MTRRFGLGKEIGKKLYPHQREGVQWLWSLHSKGTGGILADDMGLGKTMQICAFLAGLFNSNLITRVLVVAPKSLLDHWRKELGIFNLSTKTREYSATRVESRQNELEGVLQVILVTSYDIVRHNGKSLSQGYDETHEEAVTWDYMILDEGHRIKNPKTRTAKSLLAIPCVHRIIVTGTPLQNNLVELWALFNFCCPKLLGSKSWFKKRYESPILHGNEKNATDEEKLLGLAVAQDLRIQIRPYFLRRLKTEMFREDNDTFSPKLSKKVEITVWLKPSTCQSQLYTAFLKGEVVLSDYDGFPLVDLMTLKKICNHPMLLTKKAAKQLAMHIGVVADIDDNLSCKISFIDSLLDNLIQEGHSVLIFSNFHKMLNLIQDILSGRGYRFLRMDGTTKKNDRSMIVKEFQEGVGAPTVFLLTTQVGGLGLTLTKADRVIMVDPSWNPSCDNQSVERAYRIGQKKDVLVYRLITCGTVEEKIYRTQDVKERFDLPSQGFDVSLTQQQLHEEHDSEHKMDSSLTDHLKFLESLGSIASISHHSLLYSKTEPVPSLQHIKLESAPFKPKDRKLLCKNVSNKLTLSGIKQQIHTPSQINSKKGMTARSDDNATRARFESVTSKIVKTLRFLKKIAK